MFYTHTHTHTQPLPTKNSRNPLSRGSLNCDWLKPRLHDNPAVARLIKCLGAMGVQTLQTIVENHKITNEIAPKRYLTLKMRASKHPLEVYFGTKDKMAIIIQQNLEKTFF